MTPIKRPDIAGLKRTAEIDGQGAYIRKEECEDLCQYIQELERIIKDAHYQTGHWMTETRQVIANIPKENK